MNSPNQANIATFLRLSAFFYRIIYHIMLFYRQRMTKEGEQWEKDPALVNQICPIPTV